MFLSPRGATPPILNMTITVVIAAYNESATIGPLTTRLIAALDALERAAWRLIYVIKGSDVRSKSLVSLPPRPEIEMKFWLRAGI
jgi:hypothetical protein